MDIKKEIQEIIKQDSNSTLVLTDEGDDFMTFSTRENGDVGEETASPIDFDDAWVMSKILLMRFTGKIKINIEEVDEWVMLEIKFV